MVVLKLFDARNVTMKRLINLAAVAIGLIASASPPSFAAGSGLDPHARATGNSDFAGQHILAHRSSFSRAPTKMRLVRRHVH